jgi:hypothetical protein
MSTIDRRNLRKLRKYSGQVNRMLEDGTWEKLPTGRRGRLVRRLRRLTDSLLGIVPETVLRGILAGATILVLGVAGCASTGGDGNPDVTVDPDAVSDVLDATDVLDAADLVDVLDAMDAVDVADALDATDVTDVTDVLDVPTDPDATDTLDAPDVTDAPDITDATDDGGGTGITFVNRGTTTLGITPIPYTWYSVPALGDLDGDGDLDLVVGAYDYYSYTGIQYYQNTGSAGAPSFATAVGNPFGITGTGYYNAPALVDIDGDGDLDLLVADASYSSRAIKLYENTGTTSSPAFAAPGSNPSGLTLPGSWIASIVFVDIDDDGDVDLFSGGYSGSTWYHENTGTATSPAFAAPTTSPPFGIPTLTYFAAHAFADLDEDGDQDLIVMEYYSAFRYFENTGTATAPAFTTATVPSGLSGASGWYSFPTFGDIDNDGDQDLIVGEYYGYMHYYENTTP